MGFVIKPIGKVDVRVDNYTIVSDPKTLKSELIQKREGNDVIIYPEINGELDYFDTKHVDCKKGTGINSVLVRDYESKPNKLQTKLLLEITLKKLNIDLRYSVIPSRIFQILKGHILAVRDYDFDSQKFVGPPKDCCFIFRDISNINSKAKLIDMQKYISKKELNFILDYSEGWKKLDEIYAVRRIIFIGKYYVATST